MRKEVVKGRILGIAEASGKADSPGDAEDDGRAAAFAPKLGEVRVDATGGPAGRRAPCGRPASARCRPRPSGVTGRGAYGRCDVPAIAAMRRVASVGGTGPVAGGRTVPTGATMDVTQRGAAARRGGARRFTGEEANFARSGARCPRERVRPENPTPASRGVQPEKCRRGIRGSAPHPDGRRTGPAARTRRRPPTQGPSRVGATLRARGSARGRARWCRTQGAIAGTTWDRCASSPTARGRFTGPRRTMGPAVALARRHEPRTMGASSKAASHHAASPRGAAASLGPARRVVTRPPEMTRGRVAVATRPREHERSFVRVTCSRRGAAAERTPAAA